MTNKERQFDKNCYVTYSKRCEKEIKKKIALHYPLKSREEVWTKIKCQYLKFLKDWNRNLGGKKNFHNGKGGTYDCIAIMTYYFVCKEVTNFQEIEEIEERMVLPSFKKLRFVNCNKPFWKKMMYKAFHSAKANCDKWQDYKMNVAPYESNKPIYYEFVACPVAEFAKEFGLTEIMPALCNVDYKAMELIHARLIRKGTCVDKEKCDYTICGDKDNCLSIHPEYRDEKGFRRNK